MNRIVKLEENSDNTTFHALSSGFFILFNKVFSLIPCVYIKGNALRMHPCSESSAKPTIVGRVLSAVLSSHFLFPFDIFVIICIGQFLKQFLLVQ